MFSTPLRKAPSLDKALVATPSTRSSTSSWEEDPIDVTIAATPPTTPSNRESGSAIRKLSFSSSLGNSTKNAAIGSTWSAEMTCLKQASTTFEAVICLRRIQLLLNDIDRNDRIKFCKGDFENAKNALHRLPTVWSDILSREFGAIITQYFNLSPFRVLPQHVIQEVFRWLQIDEFAPVLSVCWEWYELGTADEVWRTFYTYKFLRHNPGTLPAQKTNFIQSFRFRLSDPQIGDKVEVAWRGKFRLEAMDVYQGLAWWVAEVVDKHPAQGKYKIHYPGWESRWDEWVTRSRLRWAVDSNVLCQILPGAVVELWCCGANVPGAWLESRVKKVRAGKFCINRVLSSGPLWVDRDRLRLVKHPADADNARVGTPRRGSILNMLPESVSQRLSSISISSPQSPACTIV